MGILRWCEGWNLLNLLKILDLEGIVNELRWFSAVVALCVATTLNREFYGIARGNLQELEVTVNISNQMLVIDGSFCYLPVNTQTFYIGS